MLVINNRAHFEVSIIDASATEGWDCFETSAACGVGVENKELWINSNIYSFVLGRHCGIRLDHHKRCGQKHYRNILYRNNYIKGKPHGVAIIGLCEQHKDLFKTIEGEYRILTHKELELIKIQNAKLEFIQAVAMASRFVPLSEIQNWLNEIIVETVIEE